MPTFPAYLRCPCPRHEPLVEHGDALACGGCARRFAVKDGIADLNIGASFPDEIDADMLAVDEQASGHLASAYLTPLLERLFRGTPPEALNVLSVGCGVGRDVEVLARHGFECFGIDPGNRSQRWRRRQCKSRLLKARADGIPFEAGTFDFAYLNCVLPHIGVEGDSYTTRLDYDCARFEAAREVIRVVRTGGYVLAANPNRSCPLDLFHPKPSCAACALGPRIHGPRERFLLSCRDHRDYFVARGGCRDICLLPLRDFWGFFTSSRSRLGRVAQIPLKAWLAVLSSPRLSWLRGTWMSPWLVVLARK